MQTQKDKVILDVSDDPKLKEYFSRKEPGEKCKLTMTTSLDENEGDTVILSIDPDEEIKVEMGKGEKEPAAPKENPSAAEQLYSEQSDGAEPDEDDA